MFRRASGSAAIGGATAAFLSLLRAPAIGEQALPFVMLASAMFAFFNLSRRMELIVARAAGVSAWQFLAPALLATLVIGILTVTAYNPLAAMMKEKADHLETKLFGGPRGETDTSLWFRQRGIDGQSIVHANQSSDQGSNLNGVTAFVFEQDGSFLERIDAARAQLRPGFWELSDARVNAAGEEPVAVETYFLATNLAAEQVTQAFVPPDSVPFWSLPGVERRSEEAGLDAHRYRLRFQSLLALPAFLIAMVLIAASFSLRFFRSGGVGGLVAGGVTAGFVLYVATKIIGDLGGAGLLSAPVAAWSPAILGSLLGTLALLHQEDG
jgi:lipopolysaccharide export system permease protein